MICLRLGFQPSPKSSGGQAGRKSTLLLLSFFCTVPVVAMNEALLEAALRVDCAAVSNLLERGADVNSQDADGITALSIAASCGNIRLVNLLLHNHADVNLADKNGRAPLFKATDWGHKAVIKILLDHHADMNAADNNGTTPYAITQEKKDWNPNRETIYLLMEDTRRRLQSTVKGIPTESSSSMKPG